MEQGAVLDAFLEGVDAVERVTAGFTDHDWGRPTPCAGWTAADVSAHVLCVAGWYHEWLDRAEAGHAAPVFPSGDLDRRNAEALAALTPAAGREHVAAFASSARAYAARLPRAWNLPVGYPRGTITAGLHAGLAALEWHVHAWDLAIASGQKHRPDCAGVVYEAAVLARRTASGARPAFVAARGDPWDAILQRMRP